MSEDLQKKARARQRRIETGRELEGRGFVDHAVREYLKARAPEEAARVLAAAGRIADAAKAILDALGIEPGEAGSVAPEERDIVRQAAAFFEQAGDGARARAILDALAGAPAAPATPAAAPVLSAPSMPTPPRQPIALSSGSFKRPVDRPPAEAPSAAVPSAPRRSLSSGSFRPPTRAAGADEASPPPASASSSSHARPPAVRTPAPPAAEPAARLSASGEAVTEYSGSRESGWRDAGSESIDQSITQLLESGRKGAAARVAWDAGRFEQALAWFRELGLHYQAGACLRALDRMDEALAALLEVPADGPHYRKACFELVPVAAALSRLDFDIDRYFTRFVDEGPKEPEELATFLELAELYRNAEFPRGAVLCVARILALDPTHAGALALRAQLGARTEQPRAPAPQARERGLPELPTLVEFVALARAGAPKRA